MTILSRKHQTDNPKISFLRKYGSFSVAWSLNQENLSRFEDSTGFLAFREFQNNRFVLGDPICNDSNLKHLLEKFNQEYKNDCYVQISDKTAKILSGFGYKINYFGAESVLHLPYSLCGKGKREVRNLFNAAQQREILVKELTAEEILKYKNMFSKDPEYSFLIRPFYLRNQSACRVFGAFQNDKILCYSIFDPIYLNNKIVGYAESINRRTADASKGARVFMLLKAGDVFIDEGIKFINLGLLPFYSKKNSYKNNYDSNQMTDLFFKLLYNSSPFFHNFKGLSFHKSRYNGYLLPKYFASKKKIPIAQLLHIYKLTTGSYFPRLSD